MARAARTDIATGARDSGVVARAIARSTAICIICERIDAFVAAFDLTCDACNAAFAFGTDVAAWASHALITLVVC